MLSLPVMNGISISENKSLKNLNTFGIDVCTRMYEEFDSLPKLYTLLENISASDIRMLILGGGSNILLTGDYNGIVLRNLIKGIEIPERTSDHVYLKAGAGENWHQLVQYCVENNWGGAENLSLIPGCAGAGPMQNIGAYGVELKDIFHSLEAVDIRTGQLKTFSNSECRFGYRESVFKNIFKDQFIITSITLRLNTPSNHNLNTGYGAIREELEKMQVFHPQIKDVSQAVCNIRRSKLPDPAVLGNAGSFFKNPVISVDQFEKLKSEFPNIVNYPSGDSIKLAAGWLIEQCGWKGRRIGNAGIHQLQALVIVNYGGATGREIYDLSENVLNDVEHKFGVRLEREVNII